jgi:exosortase
MRALRERRPWTARDASLLAAILAVAAWLHRQPLLDILTIGLNDEEQSHIFLAPLVAAWLLWLRRSRLRQVMVQPSLLGPLVVAAGWLTGWWGFAGGTQVAWHAGALATLAGVVLSFTGATPLRRLGPVLLVMLFMLPIPGVVRHQVAHPMQTMATSVTHAVLEMVGTSAIRSGNVLVINGEQVAVGEACNGMRLVFALTLVVFAFAFGTPLRPLTRAVLLAASPVVAIACNVIRLVPTALIYGSGDAAMAHRFHDLAGWVMLGVALLILAGLLRAIRWMEFPVTEFRLAQAGGGLAAPGRDA